MEFFLQYKWLLLILAEILAWMTTFTMFLARYWWESKAGFWISFILSFLTGIGIQLSMAVMNILKENKIGLFEIMVGTVILYGFTLGKKHVSALDKRVMKWSRDIRGLSKE